MKKIYNCAFKLVCIYILILSLFAICNIEIKVNKYSNNIQNLNQEKIIVSSLLASASNEFLEEKSKKLTQKEENILFNNNENSQEIVASQIEEEFVEKPEVIKYPVETVNLVDTSNFVVLSEETVNLSHYGHDCYGCITGQTASGYYVGDGKIYYQDKTFGSVRVVAADSKYPLGTILRLGYYGNKITAIVLDRGGSINDSSKFQIDLLAHNSDEAYKFGIIENTTLEVLRLGY